jgi:hypothetical protein
MGIFGTDDEKAEALIKYLMKQEEQELYDGKSVTTYPVKIYIKSFELPPLRGQLLKSGVDFEELPNGTFRTYVSGSSLKKLLNATHNYRPIEIELSGIFRVNF